VFYIIKMDMKNKKLKPKKTLRVFVGWILLLAGISIIVWGLFSSYQIFTAKTSAPEIFKLEELEEISPAQEDKTIKPQQEMKKILREQLKELIPTDFLPKLLNLISWSIFVWLLAAGGTRISIIGIRLIK